MIAKSCHDLDRVSEVPTLGRDPPTSGKAIPVIQRRNTHGVYMTK